MFSVEIVSSAGYPATRGRQESESEEGKNLKMGGSDGMFMFCKRQMLGSQLGVVLLLLL